MATHMQRPRCAPDPCCSTPRWNSPLGRASIQTHKTAWRWRQLTQPPSQKQEALSEAATHRNAIIKKPMPEHTPASAFFNGNDLDRLKTQRNDPHPALSTNQRRNHQARQRHPGASLAAFKQPTTPSCPCEPSRFQPCNRAAFQTQTKACDIASAPLRQHSWPTHGQSPLRLRHALQ